MTEDAALTPPCSSPLPGCATSRDRDMFPATEATKVEEPLGIVFAETGHES
jgi:hypothetical protein